LTGLALGGDDYITKPFNPLEVVARIKAILRRQNQYSSNKIMDTEEIYKSDVFCVNLRDASLTVHGEPVICTAKEFELLTYFCMHPNRIFTSTQLYEAVWDDLGLGDEKTVAMHISKLRKKLGDDSKDPKIIINLRGIGYKFIPPKKENSL
jgi:DNA-binding response OmpR family regulator